MFWGFLCIYLIVGRIWHKAMDLNSANSSSFQMTIVKKLNKNFKIHYLDFYIRKWFLWKLKSVMYDTKFENDFLDMVIPKDR